MIAAAVRLLRTTTEGFDEAVADLLAGTVTERPDAVLLLATGNTPIGGFRVLARRAAGGAVDLSAVRVVQLDEYVGVPDDDRRSLYGWLERELLTPLGIPAGRVTRFHVAAAAGVAASCRAMDDAIVGLGGLDLALLGIGPNGHLGFNEPPSAADAPTREVPLAPASIVSNAVYWGGEDQVPRTAVTVGMAPILAAREVALVVRGAHKRGILEQTLHGPETPDVPASLARRAARLTVVADEAALGG
jgi:glucosamine-6-phosphate deaminase